MKNMPAQSSRHSLLSDGRLVLSVSSGLEPALRAWLPRGSPAPAAATKEGGGAGPARIRVRSRLGRPLSGAAGGPPDFRVGPAEGRFVGGQGRRVELSAPARSGRRPRRPAGRIDLEARTAEVAPAGAEPAPPGGPFYSMLTAAAALLLGRTGAALLHAAAPVAPSGGAWLLVGDARAGKSTTCATLVRGAWAWLADDHVVLTPAAAAAEVGVEGWPRAVHLDPGWWSGGSTGRRETVEPGRLGAGPRRVRAPVAGVLLTEVGEGPSRLRAARPADAFQALVRQSPWLMVDGAAAPGAVELLRATVSGVRTGRLSVGPDTFGRPGPLLDLLDTLG